MFGGGCRPWSRARGRLGLWRESAINPVDDTTEAGWRARLFNLGFLWEPAAEDDADEMIIALEDFQAEYGLPISGQLDDATKTQISQVYGS